MNDVLKTVITYPCILGVLVVVHEWGHFIVARLCNIRVDEFSIGFGPRAIRIGKRGDTEYNIRWIPLGGYVKIAGMEPDEEPFINARDKAKDLLSRGSSETESAISKAPLFAENLPNVDETEVQKQEDDINGFYSKPLWQRSMVIFAGPLISFVFGYFLLLMMGCINGMPAASNVVAAVRPGSVAAQIHMKVNDQIVKIDNTVIVNGDQMVDIIHGSNHKVLTLTVHRGNSTVILKGAPVVQKDSGTTEPIFGFTPGERFEHVGLAASIRDGNTITVTLLTMLWDMVKRHNITDFRQHARGPVGIAVATYQAVKGGFPEVYFLAAQISISLAIFNLLPIPILDGGHLLMFAVEATRRGRRLSVAQTQNYLLAGLAIIGLLFVAIMVNDISQRFHH
jgi:regulator of sigma E protease